MKSDLTIDIAAKKLAVSRVTVYKMVNKGHLDTYKVGRATRITHESIEKFRSQGGSK